MVVDDDGNGCGFKGGAPKLEIIESKISFLGMEDVCLVVSSSTVVVVIGLVERNLGDGRKRPLFEVTVRRIDLVDIDNILVFYCKII